MKFYIIIGRDEVNVDGCDISLQKACQARGIEYVRLISEDLVLDDLQQMDIEPGSLLYRVLIGERGKTIEALLSGFHPDKLTTIYKPMVRNYPMKMPYGEVLAQITAGVNIIPTQLVDKTWLNVEPADIDDRVNRLGGYPVIFKVLGRSHGQGVFKIENREELLAVIRDNADNSYGTILRKYLADYRHYRLIVVDGKVLTQIEYHKPENDFRTNASEPIISALEPSDVAGEIGDMAVKAVELRSSLLGGVDILVDQTDGTSYLAEVNVPCYFARAEKPTGVDVGGALVDAMIQKAEKHHG